jgi:hypothetical protein
MNYILDKKNKITRLSSELKNINTFITNFKCKLDRVDLKFVCDEVDLS